MQALEITATDDLEFQEMVYPNVLDANKADEIVIDPNAYGKLKFVSPCDEDLSVGDIQGSHCGYYTSLVNSYMLKHNQEWPLKRLGNLIAIFGLSQYMETQDIESSITDISNLTQIPQEKPESKKISWGKACDLALSALNDAERKRLAYAEEEACRIAIWEETD